MSVLSLIKVIEYLDKWNVIATDGIHELSHNVRYNCYRLRTKCKDKPQDVFFEPLELQAAVDAYNETQRNLAKS